MVRRTLTALARGLGLFSLAVLGELVAVVMLVAVLLSFFAGLVFLFPPAVRLARAAARVNRRLVRAWAGVAIAEPYRPPPTPPAERAGEPGPGRCGPVMQGTALRLTWLLNDPATWRDLLFLLVVPWTGGLLVAAPVLLAAVGAVQLVSGAPLGLAWLVLAAAVAPRYAPWALRAYGYLAHALLGPTEKAELARQVRRLSAVRTEVVDAQAAELRRIERDLHDGAQARLVAVGMMIGTAERLLDTDRNAARAMLAKAREASADALHELRRIVRGIHPPVLAERGLGDAVRALALDCPLPTHVTIDLSARVAAPLESAAYFAISELLGNAARHAGATRAWVDIGHDGTTLRITVTDDGRGGADPARGTGLRGIERRIGAFDGVLTLSSPAGGPTTAVIELPQALPAPRPQPLTRRAIALVACGVLGWIPLVPQGFVPMVFKLTGVTAKSWFLGLHVAEPFQWPVIGGMILLGAGMLAFAAWPVLVHRAGVR
ncbi:sensor histidine kinase [Thermobispora bispora]|uniref:sensor histidine kinase n=1 Tax=Thermobispora bispora TaxID=2006 RepID=UPI00197CC083|nr:histidine kinase [Thermobispora bispora]QSI46668.1 sensor histidine kinase [Thermobispora bispora]